jgi:hypothetical protein
MGSGHRAIPLSLEDGLPQAYQLPGSITRHGGCAVISPSITNAESRYVEMGGMG